MPASELRDCQMPASAVWRQPAAGLEEALASADPVTRLGLLADMVAAREVVRMPLSINMSNGVVVPSSLYPRTWRMPWSP
jgi:hypothetical protein